MRYEIAVGNDLSAMVQAAFPGLDSCQRTGGGTLLHGDLPDQATLIRVLHRIGDFGLELLEVHQLPD